MTLHDPPLLFDLNSDPGERYPIPSNSSTYLEVMPLITALKVEEEETLEWAESEVDKGEDRGSAPCCHNNPETCTPFPSCCDCANTVSH